MIQTYENKYNHNKAFLKAIENDYPDEYFDWKVTVQFYYALHIAYCLLIKANKPIATSHRDNIKALGTINAELSKKLFKLLKYSKQSRYEGFQNEDSMLRINKINYQDNKQYLKDFEKANF